jgi:FkbM family methyltransferase
MRTYVIRMSKNLFINKPASWFSSSVYVNYIIFLSGFRLKSYSKFVSKNYSNFFIHQVIYDKHQIFFQSATRISRFLKGFEHAGKRMWDRYKVDKLIGNTEPKTIIDIGSNIGEFSYYANKKYLTKVKIFAFDPDPITKQCFENNLAGVDISFNMLALSNKLGEEDFYLKTDSADSSLHKPTGESVRIKTSLTTLDHFFHDLTLMQPVLLKMDAEGHEPEILLGGLSTLKYIKWVSIDAGLERYGESTSKEVVKILLEQGFSEINVSVTHLVTAKRFDI